jgi:hypothetical protein
MGLVVWLGINGESENDLPVLQATNTWEINFDEYEETINACSWYCAAPFPEVSVSSVLAPEGHISYEAQNICDYDLRTAWIEGDKGDGQGQSIIFTFNTAEIYKFSSCQLMMEPIADDG